MPPPPPQGWVLRLPPILRTHHLASRPSCSKAPRGLFVLSWVTRIFTGTSISPSPLLRQCSSRYSFRAGRNLPDKEFRYLRTVIVTAAVHRGLDSRLRSPLLVTFRHWAGVSPYTSACAFAETCVFGKQSLEPIACTPLTPSHYERKLLGSPFFQRYGVNLPSSLTEGRSFTWGDFPLPTGVGLRYGHSLLWLEAFLGGLGPDDFRPLARTRCCRHALATRIFLGRALRPARPSCPFDGFTFPTASPLRSLRAAVVQDYLTCSPSPTTLRPRLRSRLTLGRLTLPRNPQAFGVCGSHTDDATHSGIRTSFPSTSPCGLASLVRKNAPLPSHP